jgi:F-type H+-transporting ATPase subunit a
MEIHLPAEILFVFWGIPISNSFLLSIFGGTILIVVGFLTVKHFKQIPKKLQNISEFLIEQLLTFSESVVGNRQQAKEFFPIAGSFFLFILFNNWLGVFPGVGTIGFFRDEKLIPFLRPAASDLNITIALSLVSVVTANIFGIRKLGLFSHLSKFFNFTKGPIYFFVGLMELISEFAKLLSFSARLFGNIFAGKVLLLVIMTLVPFLVPLPFLALEIFIGFIQALVFAALTLIFLKIATEMAVH